MHHNTTSPWLVFADDWGRHPSSCQHLIRHILPQRHVIWVNTIGTRPPRLDWSTVTRVADKLRSWMASPDNENTVSHERSPAILSPKMWPSFRSRFGRTLNRRLLATALHPVVNALSHQPIVITTLPLTADLIGIFPSVRWVYYCVDDFTVWPGYDGVTMQLMEQKLVAKVDSIVCVSEALQERVRSMGRESQLLTHGVDLDYWQSVGNSPPPTEFAGLEPPYYLFWGVIDRRMDIQFLQALSDRLTRGTIVLVGPREDPDPRLFTLPRVAIRLAVKFTELPALAASASVLIMPYADIPATRAMQPLKLKEYLATGKPVVVRDLPATRPWSDAADLATNADEFAERVISRISPTIPENQRTARERLMDESWVAKARLFERFVETDSHTL